VLFGTIGLIFCLALVAINEKLRKQKTEHKVPLSVVIAIILCLYAVMVLLPYTVNSSVTALSIAVTTALATLSTGILGFFLYAIRDVNVFFVKNSTKAEQMIRLLAISFFYLVYAFLIGRGIILLYNGLLNVESVALAPEFELYAVPSMSIIVLIVFRFINLFKIKPLRTLGEVSQDVVIFSLLMYWISMVAMSVGLPVQSELTLTASVADSSGVMYLALVFVSISIEGLFCWTMKDLKKVNTNYRLINQASNNLINKALKSLFRERAKQTTLDHFADFENTQSQSKEPLRLRQMLDSHGIHFRGKLLSAHNILLFVFLLLSLCTLITLIAVQMPTNQTVATNAFFAEIQIVPESQIPDDTIFLSSEDTEDISQNTLYAIPIVNVQVANTCFSAPISNRFRSLNGSDYLVAETGQYLTFILKKGTVERTLAFQRQNVSYNQEDNPDFNYIGFFRDAEIYFELAKHGYNHTVIWSAKSQGMDQSTEQKIFFAEDTKGSNVLIVIHKVRPTSDNTVISSTDSLFTNETAFLIDQTKVLTTITIQMANFEEPFKILKSPW
jgi:hypothetical protein